MALLQQLRAVYGIKVKSGRGQCDRRRHETAATEIVVSSGGRGLGLKKRRGHPVPSLLWFMLKCFYVDPKENVAKCD